MELSKQEMELFLLLSELQSKTFFCKMFLNQFCKQEIELFKQFSTHSYPPIKKFFCKTFQTFTSRLHLAFIQTSTLLQLLAKPELGTTPAPACNIK